MAEPFEIPLSPEAQRFDIVLNNISYNMLIVWNPISGCWVLDIYDSNNVALVQGIPLVTGADLLAQYAYLGFGGGLVCTVDAGIGVPTFAGLGETGHLYFVLPEDQVAASGVAGGTDIYGIRKTIQTPTGGTA